MKSVLHYPCVSSATNPYNCLLISSLNKIGIQSKPCNSIVRLYRSIVIGDVVALHFHWLDRAGGELSAVPSEFLWQLSILSIILLARLLHIKTVWTVHNLEAHNRSTKSLIFYHLIAKLVNSLIAHSPSAIHLIAVTYAVSPDKIHFIPHGLYPQGFEINLPHPDPTRQSCQPLRLVYFGNISPYKGLDLLVLALEKLSSSLGNLSPHLTIIGRIDTSRFPKLFQQLIKCDNITIVSEFVEYTNLNRYISDADLIVLPFRDTLTSGSLIYALSSAKPVLISDVCSLAFYLSPDYSFKFVSGSVDSLATKLSFICKNYSRKSLQLMGQSARTFASTLDWHCIAISTSKLY
jgi:beta-1,4-mannosyltransferase